MAPQRIAAVPVDQPRLPLVASMIDDGLANADQHYSQPWSGFGVGEELASGERRSVWST